MQQQKRGRPSGYRMTAESRRKMSETQKRRWAVRLLWIEASNAILDAIANDDPLGAHAILAEYMDRREEQEQKVG